MSQSAYLQAAIKETLRFRTPGPISIPHIVDEETTVLNYRIPKDTIILANFFGSHHIMKKDWKEPEV